jgi:hypothetical protein
MAGCGNGTIHRKVKLPAGPVVGPRQSREWKQQDSDRLVQVLMKENAALRERFSMFTPTEWKAREHERKLKAAIAKSADELSD